MPPHMIAETLSARACCRRDIASFGRGLYARLLPPPMEAQLTPLQQQLMGCRTFKRDQSIPFVDETTSLKVLDTYTPAQRETAEQFTAAVAACTNFTCLKEANTLVRGRWQGSAFADAAADSDWTECGLAVACLLPTRCWFATSPSCSRGRRASSGTHTFSFWASPSAPPPACTGEWHRMELKWRNCRRHRCCRHQHPNLLGASARRCAAPHLPPSSCAVMCAGPLLLAYTPQWQLLCPRRVQPPDPASASAVP